MRGRRQYWRLGMANKTVDVERSGVIRQFSERIMPRGGRRPPRI